MNNVPSGHRITFIQMTLFSFSEFKGKNHAIGHFGCNETEFLNLSEIPMNRKENLLCDPNKILQWS